MATVSTTRLLHAEETPASRIVVLGGAPPLVKPLDPTTAESIYQTLISTLGHKDKSPEERLEALKHVSISDLQNSLNPGLPFIPSVDELLVPYDESFTLMGSDKYAFKAKLCEGAMIVFSPLDVSHETQYNSSRVKLTSITGSFC